jgi:hypothetical protein
MVVDGRDYVFTIADRGNGMGRKETGKPRE